MKKPKLKTKKISLLQYILTIIVAVILTSGATIVVYELSGTAHPVISTRKTSFSEVDYLAELIKEGYLKEVDEQKLVDGALMGMVNSLDDPYSTYFSPEEAKDFDSDLSGNFEGIGAVMMIKNDYPTIAEPPIKDSPAEKAQLKAGDMIIKVNKKEVKGKPLGEVVKEVRGEKGTSVKLEISRDNEVFTVDIVRDTIPVESVTGTIDKKNSTIGTIQITSFNETTSDEFNKIVEKLRKEGAKSFVIDLRGNPGGVLPEVEKISSRFLKDGETIVEFEDRGSKDKSVDKAKRSLDNGEKITEPTVLITDENSASASEIMAAALKDTGRYQVVGTKTFGKGTVQTLIPLDNGGEVKLTIRKWLTPKGEWINKKGVQPTIEVKYPEYLEQPFIDTSMTYTQGVIGKDVKAINIYLQTLGYSMDSVGDVYTEQTTAAIKEFQEANKIKVTGDTDKETIRVLTEKILDYWKENDTQYQKAVEVLNK
ncbi:S41 family peptidase [Vagococcus sp.]|uniref:S41 family peptidase n=1 Tax=Vagococcus sp. TaxID=1933889 RepID=UPI003F9C5782